MLLKFKNNPFLVANIIAWALLITVNTSFYLILSLRNKTWLLEVDGYVKGVLLNIVFLLFFFYHRYRLERYREKDASQLLQKVFQTVFFGWAISVFVFIVKSFFYENAFGDNLNHINFFYLLNSVLLANLLTYTLFIFRVLIFRQAPKYVLWIWNAFVYVLFASLLFNFFDFSFFSFPYLVVVGILALTALVFCANMHWVAYMDTPAKVKSMVRLILILSIYFYFAFLMAFYYDRSIVKIDMGFSVYLVGLLIFVSIYTLMAVLVLLFNIPTTAVYKRKIAEILAFQHLTQSLQVGDSEQGIYEAFLDNALSITGADAAYLETYQTSQPNFLLRGIEQKRVKEIKSLLTQKKINASDKEDELEEEEVENFGSFLEFTLKSKKNERIADLVLLKTQEEGFNAEHKDLISTFAQQVSVSIENYRLLGQVIEKEKLQQELDIAEKVQKSLLPASLQFDEQIEIFAFSESAKSVGGDYYDVFKVTPTRAYVVIGDVSGKGTSAAFNMAQMKGIFQSLAQLDMPPEYFLLYANQAVSQCFEKASFITITLLLIDTEKKKIITARAGHCPTLYYDALQKQVGYIQDKGLGLGIMRSKVYNKFIATTELSYHQGDIILLYTDGINEAMNHTGEEYGYDRLKDFFSKNIELSIQDIQKKMIQEVHQFCEGLLPSDDYTSVIIRF